MRQIRRKSAVFAISCLVGLFCVELFISINAYDWEIILHMLGYQNADAQSHEPVDDTRLIYRLKPGDFDNEGKYFVSINKLGFRDPERVEVKRDGVFRILCYGGSNVYGLGLNNGETWPAQLEAELNKVIPGKFEVWNGGACAYVPTQIVTVAREGIEKYDPDLVILGLSNGGGRPFLYGHPVKPYFNKHDELWEEFFTEDCLPFPSFLPYDVKLFAVTKLRLYRFIAATLASPHERCKWYVNEEHEIRNIADTREFLFWAKDRVPVCFFIYPGGLIEKGKYRPYEELTDTPVFKLYGTDMPKEYLDIHPPAHVMQWYGEQFALWLKESNLLSGN